jgi:predicted GNAT family acetyltransferase
MASTKVEVRDNRELRRVEAVDGDGEIAGFADYQISVDGDSFEFTHTEVDERFEGQGIGSQLAAGVMDFVRGEGATIVPTCSFLRSYMEKHEDSQDLLVDGASLGDDHEKADQSDQSADDEDKEGSRS